MSKLHELKTDPKPFQSVWHSRKTFELRPDDRDFKAGDVLHLIELSDTSGLTGRTLLALVVYVMRDAPEYGLMRGYAAMSLKLLARLENGAPCGMEGTGA